MERKGTIPPIPDVFKDIRYIDMLNELLTAFGRIQGASKGSILAHNGTEFVILAPPGGDGLVLTSDSAEATGMKWA